MKYILDNFFILLCIVLCTSCEFLDIVPNEKATEEDAFKNPQAAERFLYSCYSYIPDTRHGQKSMDLMTGDDIVTHWEHEDFAKFAQGNYTPSNPVIDYWNNLYKGIRQCYLLKNNISKVPALPDDLKNTYIAEADFLIGYYHFFLMRNYGPTILIKELFDTNDLGSPDTFLPRTSYDECVAWVANQLKDAAGRLPDRWMGSDYGRATKTVALSIRARLLLYSASPQFNGGDAFKEMYSSFKNADGTQLISTTYNVQKWVEAADAYKEAITAARAAGHELYEAKAGALSQTPEPVDLTQRSLRFTFIDKENSTEVIWAYCGKEGSNTGLQGKSIPRWGQFCWGGLAPTLRQIERFYTKNGLPIDEDPEYVYANRFSIVDFPQGDPNGEGETLLMNLGREPRFYAWIAFHNGYFEVLGEDKTAKSVTSFASRYKRGINNSKQLVQFTKLANNGQNQKGEQGTKTGYLNKKGANPATFVSLTDGLKIAEYPWPMIRLGELYLSYAEACVECNRLDEAKTFLNYVRKRAGIPTVEASWGKIGVTLDQAKLRKIVRRERQIELYLENHNFWDLRRWGIAEVLGEQPMGMSVSETDFKLFAQPVATSVSRRFIPAHYLMPIPIGEINKCSNLVQNPGY